MAATDEELGRILEETGVSKAVDHLLEFLYKEGMPTENVYSLCAMEVKKFGKIFMKRKAELARQLAQKKSSPGSKGRKNRFVFSDIDSGSRRVPEAVVIPKRELPTDPKRREAFLKAKALVDARVRAQELFDSHIQARTEELSEACKPFERPKPHKPTSETEKKVATKRSKPSKNSSKQVSRSSKTGSNVTSKPSDLDSKPFRPASKSSKPDSKPSKPDSKRSRPASKSSKQDSKPSRPASKYSEPDSMPSKTDSKPSRPNSKNSEPVPEPSNPMSKPVSKPSTNPVEKGEPVPEKLVVKEESSKDASKGENKAKKGKNGNVRTEDTDGDGKDTTISSQPDIQPIEARQKSDDVKNS